MSLFGGGQRTSIRCHLVENHFSFTLFCSFCNRDHFLVHFSSAGGQRDTHGTVAPFLSGFCLWPHTHANEHRYTHGHDFSHKTLRLAETALEFPKYFQPFQPSSRHYRDATPSYCRGKYARRMLRSVGLFFGSPLPKTKKNKCQKNGQLRDGCRC